MTIDRADRKPELRGDLYVSQTFKAIENKDFALNLGQLGQSGLKPKDVKRSRAIVLSAIEAIELDGVVRLVRCPDFRSAQLIDRRIGGHLK